MNTVNNTEIRYRLLKLLEANSNLTQRQMVEEMGFILGKFNSCLKELIKKGIVKIERFTSSDNKAGYLCISCPLTALRKKQGQSSIFLSAR